MQSVTSNAVKNVLNSYPTYDNLGMLEDSNKNIEDAIRDNFLSWNTQDRSCKVLNLSAQGQLWTLFMFRGESVYWSCLAISYLGIKYASYLEGNYTITNIV